MENLVRFGVTRLLTNSSAVCKFCSKEIFHWIDLCPSLFLVCIFHGTDSGKIQNLEITSQFLTFWNGFFWCYLSCPLPELIDISHIEEIQIPTGTRSVSGMTLRSLWTSEVSALIARYGIKPSTVQNSLGRKWDTKLKKSGSSGLFVRDVTLYEG